MRVSAVFNDLPHTKENPLLSTKDFYKHCLKRFRGIGTKTNFVDWLQEKTRLELIRPAFRNETTFCFSNFQVWQIDKCIQSGQLSTAALTACRQFETVLSLLVRIQDYYLPEVRSDKRMGQHRDYHGTVAIGGESFCTRTSYVLSGLRRCRGRLISTGEFNPAQMLKESGLDSASLRRWIESFMITCEHIDPLQEWQFFLRYASYEKRQKLKFDALFAQDLIEMAELLRLFLSEAADEPIFDDVLDWSDGPPPHAERTGSWCKHNRYGGDINKPYRMLEYLTNEYGLNAQPRAIIFTEGEEWHALSELYDYYGYDPDLLGIEFRSISGVGNFQVKKWQRFIEYMHERQTLIYFVMDKEGEVTNHAKYLLNKKRIFDLPGLTRVVPARDRIKVWSKSFEESNFTDAEIARALRQQELPVTSKQVSTLRKSAGKKGLINRLAYSFTLNIDKPRLDIDLVTGLITRRQARPGVQSLRPVESFVQKSGELILLNNQPTGRPARARNIATRLLG